MRGALCPAVVRGRCVLRFFCGEVVFLSYLHCRVYSISIFPEIEIAARDLAESLVAYVDEPFHRKRRYAEDVVQIGLCRRHGLLHQAGEFQLRLQLGQEAHHQDGIMHEQDDAEQTGVGIVRTDARIVFALRQCTLGEQHEQFVIRK
jgi:hypothetical protein